MDFKNVKTYGRFKNRVIKTDLWISPQPQRNRLFLSTSSESSVNSFENKSEVPSILAASVDTNESSSSEKTSSTVESISSKEKSFDSLSNDNGRKVLPSLSSSEKDNNSPKLLGHSTPYSSHSGTAVRPRRLPVTSPLVASDSILNQFFSPDLFSDHSQGHGRLSANENSGKKSMSNIANQSGKMPNLANQSGKMPNLADKAEDAYYAAANEMKDCSNEGQKKDSCNIDWTRELTENDLSLKSGGSNSSTRAKLEVEIKLQKLSSDDIENVSDKIRSLLLEGDSTGENSKFISTEISNVSEFDISNSLLFEISPLNSSNQAHDRRNRSSNRRDLCNNYCKDKLSFKNPSESRNAVCDERLSDSHPKQQTCTATIESASFEPKNLHDCCRDEMNSFEKGPESVAGINDSNGKNPVQTNISRTNHILGKDLSRGAHDEDVNTIDNYQKYDNNSTTGVHSSNMKTISGKLGGLRLLDAKVCLDKNDVLKSSSYSNTLASQNSTETVNVNGDVHAQRHLRHGLLPLGSSGRPPRHSSSSSGKIRFAEEVTPKTSDIHTPVSGDHTGRIAVKNPSYSSFKEALTPASFQQQHGGKTPLSPKQKILVQCEQEKPLKFTEILSASVLRKCVKVGEGTYGEVYKTNDGVEDVALKVIPVEGNFTVNDEAQKLFEEMIPEIVISKELGNLGECDDIQNAVYVCSNFIKVKRVMLVQDSYPEKLLQEWDKWKNNHNCENQRPDMFQSDQYFVVFEFMDGGEDLERFKFSSMDEALSALQQVAMSLSVAEISLTFEHRDLHWGNVLIKKTKRKEIHYKLCGKDIYVKSAGVFVSIIDFTLSRLTKDGVTVFCDLAKDPDIFKGKGDYQFQVYRLMRKANNNNWECHNPYSNLLWIRYLIDKMLNAKKYKKPNSSIQRNIRTYLRQVLSYESAFQAVQDGFPGLVFNDGL